MKITVLNVFVVELCFARHNAQDPVDYKGAWTFSEINWLRSRVENWSIICFMLQN